MAKHLLVIQVDGQTNTDLFVSRRTEFLWNDDYSAFEVVQLRWWDDASYLAYQAGDIDDGYDADADADDATVEEPGPMSPCSYGFNSECSKADDIWF